MPTLDTYAVGTAGKVVKVRGEGVVRKRIIDMGLIPGAELKVKKVAPLGDPIEINVRGYELSIRKEDAKRIEME